MSLSVIIPTFNIETYLEACLDSVVNQTYRNLEIIVIDDNSSDKTPDIIERYAAKDDRIKPVFHAENRGPGRTRNEGLDLATGEYVTFMDHDDWQPLHKYETMMEKAKERKADIVFCNAEEYDETSKDTHLLYKIPSPFVNGQTHRLDTWEKRQLALPTYLPPWAKLVHLDLIRKHRIRFSEGDNKSDDILFHYHAVLVAEQIAYLDEPLYTHRFFPDSISGTYRDKGVKMVQDRLHTWNDLEKLCYVYGIPPKKVLAAFLAEFAAYIHLPRNIAEFVSPMRDILRKHGIERNQLLPKQTKYYDRIIRFSPLYKSFFLAKKYFKKQIKAAKRRGFSRL